MFWNTYRRGCRCCCTCCPCCNACSNGNNGNNNSGNTAGTTRYVDIPATRIVVSDANGSTSSGCSCNRCR